MTDRLLARWALASALTGGLWAAGRKGLRAPPVFDPAAAGRWWHQAGPLIAALGVVRAGLLVMSAGWLAALVAATVPASRSRLGRVVPTRIRTGAAARLFLGLATGAAAGACGASGGGGQAPPAPVLAQLMPAAGRPAPSGPPARVRPAPAPPQPSVSRPEVVSRPAPARWIVRPGDDLWSIAAATAGAGSRGRRVPERAVASYWLQVIEVNRGWLRDPDLIFPGDVVTLPPRP